MQLSNGLGSCPAHGHVAGCYYQYHSSSVAGAFVCFVLTFVVGTIRCFGVVVVVDGLLVDSCSRVPCLHCSTRIGESESFWLIVVLPAASPPPSIPPSPPQPLFCCLRVRGLRMSKTVCCYSYNCICILCGPFQRLCWNTTKPALFFAIMSTWYLV